MQADSRDQAFAVLYARYFPCLVGLCRRYLPPGSDDAEAVAQEAFARAWSSIDRFSDERPFWPWLSTIARRVCVDHVRRLGRDSRMFRRTAGRRADLPLAPDELIERTSERQVVRQAFDRLTARERRLITLRDLERLSYRDIAAAEGMSVEAARSALKRARNSLRERYRRLSGGLAAIPGLAAVRRLGNRMADSAGRWNGATWMGLREPLAPAFAAILLGGLVHGGASPSRTESVHTAPASSSPAVVTAIGPPRASAPAAALSSTPGGASRAARIGPSGGAFDHGDAPQDAALAEMTTAPDGSVYATGWWRESRTDRGPTAFFRSDDGGRTWRRLSGTGLTDRRVLASKLFFPPDPDDRRIFAVSPEGLKVSVDGGESFTTMPGSEVLAGGATMSPHFSAGDPVFLGGTGVGFVYDTESKTSTIAGLDLPPNPSLREFAYSPRFRTDQTVYVTGVDFLSRLSLATGHTASVFACRAGRCTETARGDEGEAAQMPPQFAASTNRGDPVVWSWIDSNLWRAQGGGAMEPVAPPAAGLVRDVVVADGAVYLTLDRTGQDGSLYRSINGGHTWERLGGELDFGIGSLAVLPGGRLVALPYGGRQPIQWSDDDGATWHPAW